MIATCSACGAQIARYEYSTWDDPCPSCGCEVFLIHHVGNRDFPSHNFLMNVVTKEKLSSDMCDSEVIKATKESE